MRKGLDDFIRRADCFVGLRYELHLWLTNHSGYSFPVRVRIKLAVVGCSDGPEVYFERKIVSSASLVG